MTRVNLMFPWRAPGPKFRLQKRETCVRTLKVTKVPREPKGGGEQKQTDTDTTNTKKTKLWFSLFYVFTAQGQKSSIKLR